jgi:hypothetical protein
MEDVADGLARLSFSRPDSKRLVSAALARLIEADVTAPTDEQPLQRAMRG